MHGIGSMGDSKRRFLWWGVDGCQGGWLCVGLGEAANVRVFWRRSFLDAYSQIRELTVSREDGLILVDTPMGLPRGQHDRECDRTARKWVGNRRSSVFPAPCAEALCAFRAALGDQGPYPPSSGLSKEIEKKWRDAVRCAKAEVRKRFSTRSGNGLSSQALGIFPQILEMQHFRQEFGTVVREFHPEVSFRKLSKSALAFHKTDIHGIWVRKRILERFGICWPRMRAALGGDARDLGNLPSKIPYDDLLDATVGALTAKLGSTGRGTLNPNPPEEMEMVYFSPREEDLYSS